MALAFPCPSWSAASMTGSSCNAAPQQKVGTTSPDGPPARDSSAAAATAAREQSARRWGPGPGLRSGLRELLLLGLLYVAYTASRTLASGEIQPARHHAATLLALERSLNIDIELWLNHRVSDVAPIGVAASYWYAVLHYIVTPTVLTWLYRGRRRL